MKSHWPTSIRSKLLLVVLGTALATLVVALGTMLAFDARSYRDTLISDMATQTELVGQTLTPALVFGDAKAAAENLGVLRFRPNVIAAAVFLPSGNLFATYARGQTEFRMPARMLDDDVRVENGELTVFHRIREGGDVVGTLYLRASYGGVQRAVRFASIALGVAGMAMLVALGLSLWLSRVVTRPLLAVGEVARDVVRRRDYSQRAEKLSNDEVGILVESFNNMLAEIERQSQDNDAAMRALASEVEDRRAVQAQVLQLNAELETRVLDRTAQLEASNRELALATRAAEQANRAKSEFLSSMSHELRTPLNAVIGFGQLLVGEDGTLPPAKRRQFAEYILKSGSHLLTLINEVLDLARIESSNMMLSLEPVPVTDLLEECRMMIEPLARQRDIALVLPKAINLVVVADRTRLKQVLLNLLSNAIKYNRPHGAVMVDCVRVVTNIRLSVRDTGHGLGDAQRASLFQPFNRLGQEGGKEEGSGIGLVVTKRLVELMGGVIGVESTPGIGSVFWLELKAGVLADTARLQPVVSSGRQHSAPTSGWEGDLAARPALLCIEDNPANVALIEAVVAARGDLRYLAAADASLGIELARAHRPAVILMDMNLPGLNGAQALDILNADPATRGTPVIAVTANAKPKDIELGLQAGFFRYLTKPIDIHKLSEAIDDATSRSSVPLAQLLPPVPGNLA